MKMDVYLQNRKINLTQRDFKGQGGEGAVYVRQGTAYKVYADPSKALPPARIRELSVLTDPAIIKPEDPLVDSAGRVIGFTMRAISDAEPLCKTFNKAYRDQHNLTPDRIAELVRRLRTLVAHAHEKGILVVDLNEMNFLVSDDQTTLYAIDVGGYQTPGFPATAIMDSIRDRHHATFSEGTDWFSFAVITFQMFVGIHPYRGKHATLKTMDERMRANVSALNPEVGIPGTCQPIDTIPPAYRAWFEAVLELGDRVPPPDGPVASVTMSAMRPTQTKTIQHPGCLELTRVGMFDGPILVGVGDFVLTAKAVFHGSRRLADVPPGAVVSLMVTPGGTPVLAWREKGNLCLRDARRGSDISITARVDALMASEGRLYLRQAGHLLELEVVETPTKVFAQVRPIGSVLEQATHLFPGVAFQNLLGATYASLLPERGVCHQIRLPELDGYRVVDAVFQGGVLVATGEKAGTFDRFVFRFARDYRTHDCVTESDIETHEVNLLTLGSGVCLMLTEGSDGPILTLRSTRPGDPAERTVRDPALIGECRLVKCGSQARMARGATLFDMRMV